VNVSICISPTAERFSQVEPGWVIVLPIEGEYTIHAQNQLNENLGMEIHIDGLDLANKHFVSLTPFESKSSTFHMVKTSDDFELEPSKAGTNLDPPLLFFCSM
jgi:hypothetical protein